MQKLPSPDDLLRRLRRASLALITCAGLGCAQPGPAPAQAPQGPTCAPRSCNACSSIPADEGGCPTCTCGPPPPIAPPQRCADGSVEQVEARCAAAEGRCGWIVSRAGCPRVCQQHECGAPPAGSLAMCVDGVTPTIDARCALTPRDTCEWQLSPRPDACRPAPEEEAEIEAPLEDPPAEQEPRRRARLRPCRDNARCGAPPPIAPPQRCDDGREEEVEVRCVQTGATCRWEVTREGC